MHVASWHGQVLQASGACEDLLSSLWLDALVADCKEETLDRLRHNAFGIERQCSELPSHSTKRPRAVWERSEDLWKTRRVDVQKIGCTVMEGESPDPTDIAVLTQEIEERNPHTVSLGTRESLERGSCSAWGSYKSQRRKPRLSIPGFGCTVTALSDWTLPPAQPRVLHRLRRQVPPG